MPIYTVTSEPELERLLEQHDTALLDFWAPWCPPCREFHPVFEAAAERHPELAFCRVNADEAKELKAGFGVKSIPTLLVIRDRVLIVEQLGYLPGTALENLLTQVKALDMEEVRRGMSQAPPVEGQSE